MLEVSVLGPVEVRRDGRALAIPGGKTTELLVRLALAASTPVRTDRLIEDLWGDTAPSTERNTLQAKVARLRKALTEPGALTATPAGYILAVDRNGVDALAVIDEAELAATLLRQGDARRSADVSEAALARFRGDVLSAVDDQPWVEPYRAQLIAAQAALLETTFEARLQTVGPLDVIAGLESAVNEHPYRERLWALLVTALYRAGRQTDALATYERIRERLADDLGLEPGPELRELEHQILRHDATLTPSTASAPELQKPRRGNVPAMGPSLIGRDGDVAAVLGLLDNHRLVTIVGPGGVGKTALALEIGRTLDTNGGVWVVRLESTKTRDEIVDAFIAALHTRGNLTVVANRLRTLGEPVVIVDNCEHVVNEIVELITDLLDAAPGVRLLATSQTPLETDGEALYNLAPLATDDAVALFDERSRQHRRGREVTSDTSRVHDLCRALDGLPLAIELAAARTRSLSIDEIARRLDDRFSILHDSTGNKPARRRALSATIAWSYDLLFPDDQRTLWALAVFPAGATLAAVEYVLAALDAPRGAAIDALDRLATRSLVIVDDTTPARYRLLDSIRAFALTALDAAELRDSAVAARADWFEAAATVSTSGIRSRDQADYLDFARTERANLDATLAWCNNHAPQQGLTIARGFGWAWIVLGDSRGAHRIQSALDAASDATPTEARADMLLLMGWIEASTGGLTVAREHINQAAALAEQQLDDPLLRARCRYYLAYVDSHEGRFRYALELTAYSRAIYDKYHAPWDRAANALFALRAAFSAADGDATVVAAEHAREALAMVDDPWLHARHEGMLGEVARLQHRFSDAVAHLTQAADTSGRLGFLQTEAYLVASLGRAHCQNENYETGAATLALAVEKAEAIGDMRMAALARVHLGRVRRALGDLNGARHALEAAAEWHRDAGGGEQALLGSCLLAALDAAEGDPTAHERLTTILDGARNSDNQPHVEVFALDALARIASNQHDRAVADSLAEQADTRMAAASHFISQRDRTDAHR